MSTAYTSIITELDKEVSFKEFALRCSRAFGAAVEMRDELLDATIPLKFEPSDYHFNRIKEITQELESFLEKTLAEQRAEIESYLLERKEDLKNRIKKNEDNFLKLSKMKRKAEQWKPPTEDHVELKKFMIQQLEETIKYDVGTYNETYYEEELSKLDENLKYLDIFVKDKIEIFKNDIKYHEAEWKKEVERVELRNKWFSELRASLK